MTTPEPLPWICLNGQLLPASDAIWSDDSSFQRGYGLFETVLVHQRVLCGWDRHWQRLKESCTALGLPLVDRQTVESSCQTLLEKVTASADFLAARLTISGPVSHTWSDSPQQPRWLWALRTVPAPFPERSIRMGISPFQMHRRRPSVGHKTTSYLDWILIRRWAQQQGWDDAVFLNEDQQLVESSAGNLFMVVQEHLLTPGLESGCLPGTTRHQILQLAQALQIPVRQQPIDRNTLSQASYAFLSSATTGIVSIAELDGYLFSKPPIWWSRLIDRLKVSLLVA